LENERNKRLNTARNLKNSEANLTKAREDLKDMTKARDSAEAGLASAQNRPRTRQGACLKLRNS